ncbi:uncharacterized protein I206_106665 [Kwoniella pini CBS 10737]|uniref:SAC domain-containing protein n=1 Tax=Kwoniella pini CBS 10737 TaxID=1296096 RepID=A0AAJ8LBB1_9TREE
MSTLPPRFTVPPTPPRIHRQIKLSVVEDGVALSPENGEGVLVRWGVKGKVERFDCEPGEVILGGVLGIVRLWDEDIHAIPLSHELAIKAQKRLLDIQISREPKTKSRWSLTLPLRSTAIDKDQSDDSSSDEEAPEADETPLPSKTREWTKFMPKLRKKQLNDSKSSEPLPNDPPQREELEAKIVRQIIREFSNGFFFSYDFDLTHSIQQKRKTLAKRTASHTALHELIPKDGSLFPSSPTTTLPRNSIYEDELVEPDIQVPLWRRTDRRFFWNENLMKDFIDLGLHAYVIPMMQGWVQSSSFTIPIPPNPLEPTRSLGAVPVDLVVISRRSRDRAGLRYQRRGIDDEGHVANMVETEMIVRAKVCPTIIDNSLCFKVEGKSSLFSFIQVRGSIPLRWSQSPYSMKPPPVLNEPVDQSYAVANLHFNDLTARYGPIEGKEAVVTNGYRELVESLERKDVK